ncbi:alcohol dehydrogenase [Fusarium globosum]|uniref:Alcohol dehydrogenase n=1 Tax=Fusarium globosum TaxID=78864 RepID=A0A8H5YQI0_9HYPO|nr:alcohol dehydrogenase [Fusarium globosum]
MADMQCIPQKMRALQYDPSDQEAHVIEVDVPRPRDTELLVKVRCASLSHSDCLIFSPDSAAGKAVKCPMTMGHEATGVVWKIGNQVLNFEKGDSVGFLGFSGCFDCKACRTWSSSACLDGAKLRGLTDDGYLQEYVIVDARSVAKLPPDIDIPSSGPLCCAGLTAYNAIKQCNLTLGDTVAIIGVGGVGQMAVQYAKAMRLKVIAVDTNGHQLDTAKILKADYTINPETCPKYANDIRKLTYGGVNAAINFTTSKKVYDDMPSMIKWGGIFMAVGAAEEPLNVDCKSLISRQHVIKAACNGTAKDLDECLHFSAKHKIKPVVEFRALEEIPAAIELMRTGKLWNRVCVQF